MINITVTPAPFRGRIVVNAGNSPIINWKRGEVVPENWSQGSTNEQSMSSILDEIQRLRRRLIDIWLRTGQRATCPHVLAASRELDAKILEYMRDHPTRRGEI